MGRSSETGPSLRVSQPVRTSKSLPTLVAELESMIGNQRPGNCYQCAKCTSSCTASKYIVEFRPHEIVSMVRLGVARQLLESDLIWMCAGCQKCVECCPQEVSPYEVLVALRNIASEMGFIPEGYVRMTGTLLERGLVQPEQTAATRNLEFFDRESLKLPVLPTPSDMKRFSSILREAGFDKIVRRGKS